MRTIALSVITFMAGVGLAAAAKGQSQVFNVPLSSQEILGMSGISFPAPDGNVISVGIQGNGVLYSRLVVLKSLSTGQTLFRYQSTDRETQAVSKLDADGNVVVVSYDWKANGRRIRKVSGTDGSEVFNVVHPGVSSGNSGTISIGPASILYAWAHTGQIHALKFGLTGTLLSQHSNIAPGDRVEAHPSGDLIATRNSYVTRIRASDLQVAWDKAMPYPNNSSQKEITGVANVSPSVLYAWASSQVLSTHYRIVHKINASNGNRLWTSNIEVESGSTVNVHADAEGEAFLVSTKEGNSRVVRLKGTDGAVDWTVEHPLTLRRPEVDPSNNAIYFSGDEITRLKRVDGSLAYSVARPEGDYMVDRSSFAVANGRLLVNGFSFAGNKNQLYRAADGKHLKTWQFETPVPGFNRSVRPLKIGSDAVVATYNYTGWTLSRLSPSGGSVWTRYYRVPNEPDTWNSPELAFIGLRDEPGGGKSILAVGRLTSSATVSKIDPATGDVIWHSHIGRSVSIVDRLFTATITPNGDVIAVSRSTFGSSPAKVMRVDGNTGDVSWSREIAVAVSYPLGASEGDAECSSTASGDVLYYTARNLYRISGTDGTIQATRSLFSFSPMARYATDSSGHAFVISQSGASRHLHKIDPVTLDSVFSVPLPASVAAIPAGLRALGDGTIGRLEVRTDGSRWIVATSPDTGAQQWAVKLVNVDIYEDRLPYVDFDANADGDVVVVGARSTPGKEGLFVQALHGPSNTRLWLNSKPLPLYGQHALALGNIAVGIAGQWNIESQNFRAFGFKFRN